MFNTIDDQIRRLIPSKFKRMLPLNVKKSYEFGISLYTGWRDRKLFDDVLYYCMFIGYPRSGHSLIGTLLNAHKNAVIAQELNALKYIQQGFARNQIFALLLRRDNMFALSGRTWNGYRYAVSGQWQGRYEQLTVIGDKRGGTSSELLYKDPELLFCLRKVICIPLRIIHVVRNPYDNISTLKLKQFPHFTLQESVDFYFSLCNMVSLIIRNCTNEEVITIHYEEFMSSPVQYMRLLCDFLGLDCYPGYAESCTNILFDKPKLTRHQVQWTDELRAVTQAKIKEISFLRGYSFEA